MKITKNKMEEEIKKQFNKEINQLRDIQMSEDEKAQMLSRILSSDISNPKPIVSPYGFKYFIMSAFRNSKMKLVYSLVVVFLLTGSGVAFASLNSLPGDVFYPLKVRAIEPVVGFAISKTEDKAVYQTTLAIKRLEEAEKLSKQNALTAKREEQLKSLLDDHVQNLNANLETLSKEEPDTRKNERISVNFRAQMQARAQILEEIDQSKIIEISEKEKQLLKKKILETAREKALKIRENSTKNNAQTAENYKNKKAQVQLLLDTTSSEILLRESQNKTVDDTTIKHTEGTVSRALELLKEADEAETNGETQEAYQKLLDSESYIKEAEIFLNLKIKSLTQ